MESWGVVGWRHLTEARFFNAKMDEVVARRGWPARVVSGGAAGADTLAREWAKKHNIEFVEYTPVANVARFFLERNTKIVAASDVVIAFAGPDSRGTWDTVRKAQKANKPVRIFSVP